MNPEQQKIVTIITDTLDHHYFSLIPPYRSDETISLSGRIKEWASRFTAEDPDEICPICEEQECDGDCPLRFVRNNQEQIKKYPYLNAYLLCTVCNFVVSGSDWAAMEKTMFEHHKNHKKIDGINSGV